MLESKRNSYKVNVYVFYVNAYFNGRQTAHLEQ